MRTQRAIHFCAFRKEYCGDFDASLKVYDRTHFNWLELC
jgi:hypothetical protein